MSTIPLLVRWGPLGIQLSQLNNCLNHRLGTLIRDHPYFQRKIIRVNEAHSIHTAGTPLYGLSAFRPAWGKLDELEALLPDRIPTCLLGNPPTSYLEDRNRETLKHNYIPIRVTSNRRNTIYATHQVHGSIEDTQNYQRFITEPFDLQKQPHVLIFVDDKNLTMKIARHFDTCLPILYRGRGIIKYISGMSEAYLQQTHESFVSKDGMCRILIATSGESVVSDTSLCLFMSD